MSQVTTHVLDTARGCPAAGVPVELRDAHGSVLASSATGPDGRVTDLGPDVLVPGTYRLVFDTAAYFATTGQEGFFPLVTLDVLLTDPAAHYHVPLLLSSFAYSTYRGS